MASRVNSAGNQEAAYVADPEVMDEYVVGYCRTHVNPYRKGPSAWDPVPDCE